MYFIALVSIIVIANTLFMAWFIKQYFNHQMNKKFLELEMCHKACFTIQESMICIECDCIFSKKIFHQCPVCGNDQNFYLNVAVDPIMQHAHQKKLERILQ